MYALDHFGEKAITQHVGFIFVFVFICIPCHVDCFHCLAFESVLDQLLKKENSALNTQGILTLRFISVKLNF